jgi:hypothetical protein
MIRCYVCGSVFCIALALWTWKLVEPNPLPTAWEQSLSADWRFWLAKLAHAGVYAALTVLGRYRRSRRTRWLIVGLLLLHAVGTEIVQTFVPNRHGTLRDVLIDWLGIAAGVTFERIGQWWWAAPQLTSQPPGTCYNQQL